MGKHKRTRKSNRSDPLARKTAQDEKIVNEKILPLLEQLKSHKPAERAIAIGAMNAMADDPKLRRMLMKEKALQTVLSHTLTDSSQEITSESYGFLRNVVLEEGRDVAVFLHRQNILASLDAALKKLLVAWEESMEKLTGQDRATVVEFGENLLGLLVGMALADDAIYDSIITNVAEQGIALAKKMLTTDYASAVDAALELLYVLSEDNPEVAAKLQDLPVKTTTLSSKVYSLGIQYNLHEVNNNSNFLPILKGLVDVLNDVDAGSLDTVEYKDIKDPSELKAATLRMAAVRSQINAVQVSLELFGAITETLVENQEPDALMFLQNVIIPLCLQILERKEFTFRAISALNNIGWTMDSAGTEWAAAAEKVWAQAEDLAGSDDIDTASASLGALGAVAKHFEGVVPIKPATIELILSKCTALKNPETKEEFMQFVQPAIVLLTSVAVASQNLKLTASLADVLLEIIKGNSEVPVPLLMETIDALFELFGDNEAPAQAIYVDKQISNVLKETLPQIKRELKSVNKNANPGLWEQSHETLLNLTNFIEYKG